MNGHRGGDQLEYQQATGPRGLVPAAGRWPTPGDSTRITQHRLTNGLRVITWPDRTLPQVGAYLRYAVGSRHEQPGQFGLAHLFEHLMFSGTRRLGKGEHLQLVQSVGGNANATTSTDWTSYYHVVGSEALELVLWLEAERLRGLPEALTAEKIKTEVQVVLNERLTTLDNIPYGNAAELIAHAAFPDGHPYQHLPIGHPADLEAASLGDVLRFFECFYQPGNAVPGLAGDFETEDALALADQYLGRVPGGHGSRLAAPPPARLRGRVQIDQAAPGGPRLFIGVLMPPASSVDYDKCRVMATVLAGSSGGWLVRRLGWEQGLVADVRIRLMAQAVHSSLAIVELIPQDGCDLTAVEDAYRSELLRLADQGIEPDELARSIAMHTSSRLARADRVGGIADDLSLCATISADPGLFLRSLAAVQVMAEAEAAQLSRRFAGADGSVVLKYTATGGLV